MFDGVFEMENCVDLSQPKWDQSHYFGRARHFFSATNPMNLFVTPSGLENAKLLVESHKKGEKTGATVEELWNAKYLTDSAYHPDTGEKMLLVGRMSAQVPMNMAITGSMMTFYKSTPQVVFWQWFNQSFNALVNYTNRSGDAPISTSTLGTSYVCATGGALGTALGLNSLAKTLPTLWGRFVPFVACSIANSINIPMMRKQELSQGIPLQTKDGTKTGESSVKAAQKGISMVVASRVLMASPGMILVPMFADLLEKRGVLAKYPRINAPTQILLCGFFLTFATPLCCAIFPQMTAIHVDSLEPDIAERLKQKGHKDYLYFNKGL